MDVKIKQDGFTSRLTYCEATGEVLHELVQDDRDIILARNAELRKNPDAVRDLSFGRLLASVPNEDWEWFLRQNKGFYQMPKEERDKRLMAFLKTTERGKASMVREEGKHKYLSMTSKTA